jgi:hypothetical protein
LTQKYTCNICTEEVFSRFTSKGKLSGCNHDFCYRCIWKWENKTIKDGQAFHCPLCRKKRIPMDELQKVEATHIPTKIHLCRDVVFLDSDKDDISEDYWHCKICNRSFKKLESKDQDVRATGTTSCCYKEVACFVCLKTACKRICDKSRKTFRKHHPSIVLQRDRDYLEWYWTYSTHRMSYNKWICLCNVYPNMIPNATTLLQVPATSNEIDNEQQDQQIDSNEGIENLPPLSSSDEDDDPTKNYTGSDVD